MGQKQSIKVTEMGGDTEEAERRLPPTLRRAWYRLNQTFRRRITHLEITPDQFTILRWLSEHQSGLTQKAVAEKMASDPNTIAAIVRRMEEAKLISRLPNQEDRREMILQLLPDGRRKFKKAARIAHRLEDEVLGGIPQKERGAFLKNLARLALQCDAAFESES